MLFAIICKTVSYQMNKKELNRRGCVIAISYRNDPFPKLAIIIPPFASHEITPTHKIKSEPKSSSQLTPSAMG